MYRTKRAGNWRQRRGGKHRIEEKIDRVRGCDEEVGKRIGKKKKGKRQRKR